MSIVKVSQIQSDRVSNQDNRSPHTATSKHKYRDSIVRDTNGAFSAFHDVYNAIS